MFFQLFITVPLLFQLCSTALGQLTISSALSTTAPVAATSSSSSGTIGFNFTSTSFNINATATSTPPVDACIIFVGANGTVPAFTITSQFPVPTSTFVSSTLNSTSTTSDSFNVSTSRSSVSTERFNSTLSPGPFPTSVFSFATTFYATVWTSGELSSTSYGIAVPTGVSSTSYGLAVPSGLPICPNVTLSSNGTVVNGTNTTSGSSQSLNSTGNGNDNKPSSAISMKKISRDITGAVMGAIGGVVLAVI